VREVSLTSGERDLCEMRALLLSVARERVSSQEESTYFNFEMRALLLMKCVLSSSSPPLRRRALQSSPRLRRETQMKCVLTTLFSCISRLKSARYKKEGGREREIERDRGETSGDRPLFLWFEARERQV